MNNPKDRAKPQSHFASAADTMEMVEAARQTQWERPTVAGQVFMGRLLTEHLFPYAIQSEEDRRIGDEFLAKLEAFLKTHVDPEEIDRTGEIPAHVIQGLAQLGCFGMKIPKEYGGLGLSQVNYNRAIALIASWCGSTAVWLSAHQSIGVPQPILLFGTEEQKRKYLPLAAKGGISAFALTEPNVGSDPANMSTTATPIEGGEYYLLNGEKLWCTNGPVAEVLVVMARTPDRVIGGKPRKQITAFLVERNWPGVEVVHRCEFMGLKGIQNGLLRFTQVRVPKENILWGLGRGLKLALITLNTGRLTLPAGTLGGAKQCLRIARQWALKRHQWGGPIGHHEAIASKLGWMAAHLFAMEAVTWLVAAWADRKDLDIRIEAAMAKLFCTEVSWTIADETLQIRGGRGYETARSLKARGEDPIPVERIFRDARINRIIEGTSEIMRLFLAREALDPHLRLVFDVILPNRPFRQRIKAAFKALRFYALWYPRLWWPVLGMGNDRLPAGLSGRLAEHWRYVQRQSRRLARVLFHQMIRHGQRLERRQMVLFRLVDAGVDLFVMGAVLAKAAWMGGKAIELADLFCTYARSRIEANLKHPSRLEDAQAYRIAQALMRDEYLWLEEGILIR
jgi:hypothetical protein